MQVVSDTIVSASGDGSLRVWGIEDLRCRKVNISAAAILALGGVTSLQELLIVRAAGLSE